jgi:copper homeostasis protein
MPLLQSPQTKASRLKPLPQWSSAKHQLLSGMHHRRPLLSDMEGGELGNDVEQIRGMVAALNAAAAAP